MKEVLQGALLGGGSCTAWWEPGPGHLWPEMLMSTRQMPAEVVMDQSLLVSRA